MFELKNVCTSYKCGYFEFSFLRSNVQRKSTSGQQYTISQVVCPKCGMWAKVAEIREVA